MKTITFIKSVYHIDQLPKKSLPEVILCGRSNVGKSSFINSLFGKKIAKTSSSPGKTRSINYYLVNEKFYMVDLPGFGYAKVSKSERNRWESLIEKFFLLKRNDRLAIHLIDSRYEPMQNDIQLNNYLKEFKIPYIVILNKIDKLKQSEIEKAKTRITEYFNELIFNENLLTYSSVTGKGKKEIDFRIEKFFA